MTTLALPSAAVIDQLDPLQQVVLGYLAKLRSDSTRRAYTEDLTNFFAWCEQVKLAPLTAKRAHIDLYRHWMQSQNRWAESTIARRIGTVCGLFKYATMEEYLDRDRLSPIEFARLLQAAQDAGRNEHALVGMLGMMGLRISEALQMDVTNVTRDSGYIVLSFIGKGDKAARMPVPIPVMRALEEVIAGRDEGPILRNRRGERMDRPTAARTLERLGRLAEIDHRFTAHSLRRTFCTTGLLSKVPLYDMQLAMRHSNPNTTSLYDMAKGSLDRNAVHQVAGYMAALAG